MCSVGAAFAFDFVSEILHVDIVRCHRLVVPDDLRRSLQLQKSIAVESLAEIVTKHGFPTGLPCHVLSFC